MREIKGKGAGVRITWNAHCHARFNLRCSFFFNSLLLFFYAAVVAIVKTAVGIIVVVVVKYSVNQEI